MLHGRRPQTARYRRRRSSQTCSTDHDAVCQKYDHRSRGADPVVPHRRATSDRRSRRNVIWRTRRTSKICCRRWTRPPDPALEARSWEDNIINLANGSCDGSQKRSPAASTMRSSTATTAGSRQDNDVWNAEGSSQGLGRSAGTRADLRNMPERRPRDLQHLAEPALDPQRNMGVLAQSGGQRGSSASGHDRMMEARRAHLMDKYGAKRVPC